MERNQLLSFIYGLFFNHTGDASLFRKIGTLQEFCDLIQIKKIVDTQLNFKVFFFNWIFKNDQLHHKHLTFGWVSIGKVAVVTLFDQIGLQQQSQSCTFERTWLWLSWVIISSFLVLYISYCDLHYIVQIKVVKAFTKMHLIFDSQKAFRFYSSKAW